VIRHAFLFRDRERGRQNLDHHPVDVIQPLPTLGIGQRNPVAALHRVEQAAGLLDEVEGGGLVALRGQGSRTLEELELRLALGVAEAGGHR
jgi:hypothetical protein